LITSEPGSGNKPSASATTAEANASVGQSSEGQSSEGQSGEGQSGEAKPAAAQPAAVPTEQGSQPSQPEESGQHPAAGANSVSKSSAAAKPKPDAARASAVEPEADARSNKMLLLGEKYLYGRGVPKSCNQALAYLRAAADAENAPAMSHLGAMYASGNCVAMNRATAYGWFARAENADPNNQWLTRNLNMLWRDMSPQERAAINR
jgi:TPR repeat protein